MQWHFGGTYGYNFRSADINKSFFLTFTSRVIKEDYILVVVETRIYYQKGIFLATVLCSAGMQTLLINVSCIGQDCCCCMPSYAFIDFASSHMTHLSFYTSPKKTQMRIISIKMHSSIHNVYVKSLMILLLSLFRSILTRKIRTSWNLIILSLAVSNQP